MKYPKRLRHRGKGKVWATIYQRPDGYRLYWRARVDGKPRSHFQDFPTYSEAKRKDIAEAVEEFITAEEPRTKAGEGHWAQLSAKYAYNRAIMLRRFAGMFPDTAICDLAKEHLDAFINGLATWKSKSRNGKPVTSAKGRNYHRAAIRQFLQWAVRKDYLPMTHRLGEEVEAWFAVAPEQAANVIPLPALTRTEGH